MCGDSPASRTAQSSSGSARRHPDTCAHRRMAAQAVRRAALPARIALRGSRAALRIAARIALRIAARLAAWNLSMCRPPFRCGSVCAGALFHAGGGIALRGRAPCIPGAEPGRHLQPQQKRYPAGGLPCLPPADPAFPEAAGGAWRFWSPASPAFSFIFCPHPPARARRALFPSGEGGDSKFISPGASPPAPLH